MSDREAGSEGWSEQQLAAFERMHADGVSVQTLVEAFAAVGTPLTEATFRKYVQLGLLPRSVRVGRKGKHRGSQGLYPATVVRRIEGIRRLMAQGFTIDEIQREFFFARGDVEELSRSLERVYAAIEKVVEGRGDELAGRQLEEAKKLGAQLLEQLDAIEQRMSMRARMARAAV